MSRDDKARMLRRIFEEGLPAAEGGLPAQLDFEQVEACRAAVFEAMDRLQGRVKRRLYMAFGFTAAASLVLGLAAWLSMSSRVEDGFGYRVGASGLRTETGWISNDGDKMLPIVFENGTKFVLNRKSAAKVVEADSRRVRIDLNKGAVTAKVNGNGKTEWVVEAGPYTVKVLGTEFQVVWDADKERLKVAVSSGHVSVSGVSIGEQGVILKAGNRLVSDSRGAHISTRASIAENEDPEPLLDSTDAPPVPPSLSEEPATDDSIERDEPTGAASMRDATRKAPSAVTNTEHSSKPPWRVAVEAGDLRGAIKAMEQSDAFRVGAEADIETVWRLAEEARRVRRPDLSDSLFEAVRRRSPGTERAATAAFLLGKTALDVHRDAMSAKRWLNTYLNESPNGALAEEARGRLMEALVSLGYRDETRRVAADYLIRYPSGSFVAQAKDITERSN